MVDIPSAPTEIKLKYCMKDCKNVGGVSVYTFYVNCVDYVPIPLEANVRGTSESAPYKHMIQTLIEEPQMFFFKNGGINVIAEDVKIIESQSIAELRFKKDFGILNGGHTQKAILDCKEQHDISRDAIVRVEVIQWDLNNKTIAELASAKNSSSNVKQYSIANKIGRFKPLQNYMEPLYEQKITWYENEEIDGKSMSSVDLIAILNMFDIDKYDKYNPPTASANSTGKVFESWMRDEDRLVKVYPLVNDILDLYEYIQTTFHKDIQNGLTKRSIIKRVPKNSKSSNARTIFSNKPIEFILPKQILMPLLGAMRADIRVNEDDGGYEWIMPPKQLFDLTKKELTTTVNNYLKQNDINKMSKDPNLWTSLYNIVVIAIMTSEQESNHGATVES